MSHRTLVGGAGFEPATPVLSEVEIGTLRDFSALRFAATLDCAPASPPSISTAFMPASARLRTTQAGTDVATGTDNDIPNQDRRRMDVSAWVYNRRDAVNGIDFKGWHGDSPDVWYFVI